MSIDERNEPEVGGLSQGLVREIVCRETEAVDLDKDVVTGNGLGNIILGYYRLVGILAGRRPRVTKYQVPHL